MTEPKCNILRHNPPAGLLHLKGDHGRVEGDEIRRGRLLAVLRVWGETWRLRSAKISPLLSAVTSAGVSLLATVVTSVTVMGSPPFQHQPSAMTLKQAA